MRWWWDFGKDELRADLSCLSKDRIGGNRPVALNAEEAAARVLQTEPC